tara:strand:- start:3338 stop:3703 length:366 start_codon:yes stop_codon:yes gene_type:complete
LSPTIDESLPPIPAKRYFAIGEASTLCGVKPHVLRYWEQEFPMLSPVKRRGNRRYFRVEDIKTARMIRQLLYGSGFTIAGARARLLDSPTDTHEATTVAAPTSALPAIRAELESLLKKLGD